MSRSEAPPAALGNAADRVTTAINDVAQVMADAVETAGNLVHDGLDHRASAIRDAAAVAGVLGWLGGLASGAGDLLGALVVGLGAVIAGVLGGSLRVAGGIAGRRPRVIRDGLIDVASGTLGAVLVVVGKLVALLQASLGIEARKRRLSADEIRILSQVFRASLALYNLRIVAGRSGAFRVTDRPFTLGNTIYMKATGGDDWIATLVHECTHVWQYQHLGSRYATDALGAQLVQRGNGAYDWQRALPGRWRDFNKEAQAEAVEDVYRFAGLVGVIPPGAGAFFDADGVGRIGTFVVPPAVLPVDLSDEDRADLASLTAGDFTELAHDAVTAVRSRTSVRGSRHRAGLARAGR